MTAASPEAFVHLFDWPFARCEAELPALVERAVESDGRRSVFGHSMGGHGALVVALRNPQRYAAVSAFAPPLLLDNAQKQKMTTPPISSTDRMSRVSGASTLASDGPMSAPTMAAAKISVNHIAFLLISRSRFRRRAEPPASRRP